VAPDGVTRYTTPSGSPLHTADVVLTPGEVSVMVVQIETDRSPASELPRPRARASWCALIAA